MVPKIVELNSACLHHKNHARWIYVAGCADFLVVLDQICAVSYLIEGGFDSNCWPYISCQEVLISPHS